MTSCIKGRYDFIVEFADCRNLIYTDISDWMSEDHYVVPEAYELRIKAPNKQEYSYINVYTNKVTVLKASDLGIAGHNELYIPDGIYEFSVDNCGTVYTRYAALACTTRCKLDSLIATSDLDRELQRIQELEKLYEATNILTEMRSIEKAQFYFKKLRQELDCVKCNCP